VAQDSGYRCGYCLTSQEYTAMPMHIEHIIPIAAGGQTVEENLWLACPLCNGFKGAKSSGYDPHTGNIVRLYNPRQQNWNDHFDWSDNGLEVVGKTPAGRATVVALKLNNNFLMTARSRWSLAGWHPPQK
jgi:hypothetical protein